MSENTVVVLRRLRAQMTASSITATMIRMTMDALVHVKMIVTGSSAEEGGFRQSINQPISQSINQSINQSNNQSIDASINRCMQSINQSDINFQ